MPPRRAWDRQHRNACTGHLLLKSRLASSCFPTSLVPSRSIDRLTDRPTRLQSHRHPRQPSMSQQSLQGRSAFSSQSRPRLQASRVVAPMPVNLPSLRKENATAAAAIAAAAATAAPNLSTAASRNPATSSVSRGSRLERAAGAAGAGSSRRKQTHDPPQSHQHDHQHLLRHGTNAEPSVASNAWKTAGLNAPPRKSIDSNSHHAAQPSLASRLSSCLDGIGRSKQCRGLAFEINRSSRFPNWSLRRSSGDRRNSSCQCRAIAWLVTSSDCTFIVPSLDTNPTSQFRQLHRDQCPFSYCSSQ
ncbi:hypothetical protein BC831DRAFT_302606 [Entophlyctis helioformis]|nr:hypothetical protein BC831DRAFT_302606 [Entophlyctis helioformis]